MERRRVLIAGLAFVVGLAVLVAPAEAQTRLRYPGANIRLEEGLHLLPNTLQRAIHILIAATGAVTLAVAAVAIAVATMRNLQNATPTLGIPYWVFFSASFLGFLFAAAEFALQLWKALVDKPPYVAFPDEASPDDLDALEAALVAEADRGVGESPR